MGKEHLGMHCGECVIEIPDIAFLRAGGVSDFIKEFEGTYQAKPVAVAVPIVNGDGVAFGDSTLPTGKYLTHRGTPLDFASMVKECTSKGLDVYLTLDPTLEFVRTSALHIVDIVGDSSSHVCFYKRKTRHFLKELVRRALSIATEATGRGGQRVRGLGVDIVNLWPMGASNEGKLELNCFCRECMEALDRVALRDYPSGICREFGRFPNPWNLMLQDEGTGLKPLRTVGHRDSPIEVVEKSRQVGFAKIYDEHDPDRNLVTEATVLLRYLEIRHQMVVEVLHDLFVTARQHGGDNISRVIYTENDPYDFSAGVFVEKLDDPTVCDELWLDPSEFNFAPKTVKMRSYMVRRNRYFIDHFISVLYSVQDINRRTTTGLANFSDEDARELVRRRGQQVCAALVKDRIDVETLPDLEDEGGSRLGLVAPIVSERIVKSLVDKVTPMASGADGNLVGRLRQAMSTMADPKQKL
ncbi:MAG: hypothetical protein HY914_16385 [Desulfomonile tiedjei]|nr:hypothetical protein [Desulfomonile tiedjei]